MIQKRESGFTAVELLITLFVAAAFLIAAYQLFNLVIKDGGATRAESRAANVAYDYLRQYAASSTTTPCTQSSPLSDMPVSIDGLANATIDVNITCMPDQSPNLSNVEVDITYNTPSQTVVYNLLTSAAGGSTTDITNGLVAWYKLNGNGNTSVGSPNGTVTNATPTADVNGTANGAYSFTGTNSNISSASAFNMPARSITISTWVNNPTASNYGSFVNLGNGSNGYGVGIGASNFTSSSPGTKLVMLYEGVRWITTTTDVGTGWHHVVMEIDASGVASAYLDGAAVTGVSTGAVPAAPTALTNIGGTSTRYFTGSIDDTRLYSRTLSQAEVIALFNNGPK